MKVQLRNFVLYFFCLFCKSVVGQIPSDPYFTAEDTLRAVLAHQPGRGFKLIDKKEGSLTFSAYVSSRYLNQKGLDSNYTDAFGRTFDNKKRNDIQYQKVMLYF